MDTRQLRYFVAVAEHGGVTKAAKALRVAQPTLTQGLRALERDLGLELFYRVGRGMVLSAAGEALLGPARQVRGGLAALTDKARSIAGLDDGWLNLVTSPSLGVDPLSDIIGMFRARYPKVCVNVLDPGTTSIVELLRTASCEIAMTFLPAAVTGMVSVPLGVRRLRLVLPPESPIGSRMPIRLAEFARLPLVAGPRGNPIRELLEVSCAPGAPLNIAVETESEEHARDLVLEGTGAALLPQSLAEQAGLRGALVRRTDPVLEQCLGLVHRSGRLSPAAGAFVDVSSEFAAAQDL